MQASTRARLALRSIAPSTPTHGHTYTSLACSQASTSHSVSSNSPNTRRAASTVTSTEIPIPVINADVQAPKDTKGKGREQQQRIFIRQRGPSKRELPLRKQFLFQQYKHVFSSSPVLVFLKPGDFTVEEITRLRVDLSLIKRSSPSKPATPPNAEGINAASADNEGAKFLFLRAGLLPPLLESLPDLPSKAVMQHIEAQGRNLAVLTLPSLDPPALKAALAAVAKLSKSPNVRKLQAEASAKAAAGSKAGTKPGGAPPTPAAASSGGKKEERLAVVSAIVENRAMDAAQLKDVAALPGLEQILAQLVGLIETPARQIIGLTQRAAGQDLVRTLEGFKVGLEESQNAGTAGKKGGESAAP